MPRVSLTVRIAVAGAAIAALLAWPAGALGFETILQDDARTLQGTNQTTLQTFQQIARLGVDRVRITVNWAQIAPAPHAQKKPRRFDASDPVAYMPTTRSIFRSPLWLVDRAVTFAQYVGLKVDLVLGVGAPRWAAAGLGTGPHAGAVVRPNPREFAAFARAMARRYSGAIIAPWGVKLARVDMFELWNEPNVPYFAQPQFAGGKPVAADSYRNMVRAAYPAIKSANPGATVLVGSTAATGGRKGGANTPIGPLAFVRRLACVDLKLRPIRTGGCRGFRRVSGDGFSHHPYVLKARPGTPGTNPEDVRMGSLGRLTSLLDKLVARGRISRGLSNLWLTEFGYETNAPVPNKPWSLTQQARFLAAAEYIARQDPHVRSYSQFLLRDIGTGAALRAARRGSRGRVLGSWQTGLFFEDGRPKPSAESFRLTLLPFRSSQDVISFYGHVRPARAPVTARIEQQQADGSWQPIASSPSGGGPAEQQFTTAGDGTFLRQLSAPGLADASFRLVWVMPDGSVDPGPAQSIASL